VGLKYFVLDTETTGLRPGHHEITEISVIRYDDRNQLTRKIKPLYPQRADWNALKATGRTKADLYKGEDREKVIAETVAFFNESEAAPEERCIIAFNAHFDRNFLFALFKELKIPFPAHCWVDARSVARVWAKKLGLVKPKLSQASVLEFTKTKTLPGAHTAIIDTRNLYFFWKNALENEIDFFPFLKNIPHSIEDEKPKLSFAEMIEETSDEDFEGDLAIPEY